MNGSVPRSRQRKKWWDCMNETLKRKYMKSHINTRACMKRCMDVNEAKVLCQNMDVWREIVYKKRVTKSVSGVIVAWNERFWIIMGPLVKLYLVDVARVNSEDLPVDLIISLSVYVWLVTCDDFLMICTEVIASDWTVMNSDWTTTRVRAVLWNEHVV